MAPVAELKMSLEDFHARYDGEKPYFEYWDGEALQKAGPTFLHGLIQKVVSFLLDELGYESACEVTLKLVDQYQPVPDVIAVGCSAGDVYPTQPFEVVVEILSPLDSFSRVLKKCHLYEQWGIRQIVIVDPQERRIWLYENGAPRPAEIIARRGDRSISAAQLWAEVDRRLAKLNS